VAKYDADAFFAWWQATLTEASDVLIKIRRDQLDKAKRDR